MCGFKKKPVLALKVIHDRNCPLAELVCQPPPLTFTPMQCFDFQGCSRWKSRHPDWVRQTRSLSRTIKVGFHSKQLIWSPPQNLSINSSTLPFCLPTAREEKGTRHLLPPSPVKAVDLLTDTDQWRDLHGGRAQRINFRLRGFYRGQS